MTKHSTTWAITATLVAALACAGGSDALAAKKKMSYEDAFAKCKQELDAAGVPGVQTSATARSTAGGACMKKYGYRLKK
jgi:hypothetical protein